MGQIAEDIMIDKRKKAYRDWKKILTGEWESNNISLINPKYNDVLYCLEKIVEHNISGNKELEKVYTKKYEVQYHRMFGGKS